jgi:hypothetical protein
MDLHGSNVSSPKINKDKTKKSFMQQLASSTADTPVSAIPIGGTDHGQVVDKQVTPILGIRLSVKKRKLTINAFLPFAHRRHRRTKRSIFILGTHSVNYYAHMYSCFI